MATSSQVPLVDLRDFGASDPARRQAFVRAVGDPIRELGFVRVTGHGVLPALIDPAYAAARAFC